MTMGSCWRLVGAVAVVGAALCLGGAGGAAAGGEVRLWAGAGCGRRLLYTLESGVLLERRAGWRLQGALAVTALAYCDHTHEALLRFELVEMSVQGRGAGRTAEWQPRPSAWSAAGTGVGVAHAHWRAGRLVALYLPPDDPPAIANYKRALISLFQFQILDGERNETDASGACAVRYETLGPLEFRKIKSGCQWEGGSDAGAAGGTGSEVRARRLTRYTLREDQQALSAVVAEEEVVAGAEGVAGGKARSWARLALKDEGQESGEGCVQDEAGLPAALRRLPHGMAATSLQLQPSPESEECIEEDAPLSVEEAIALLAAAGREGDGDGKGEGEGETEEAEAMVRAYSVVRAASAAQLTRALQGIKDIDALTRAARGVGGAGGAGAVDAAGVALQLRAGDPLQPAADAFLAAFALAPEPHARAIKGVVSLSSESRDARVRSAALLAAAAAASATSTTSVSASVRDHLVKHLPRCKDEACRELHITAVGNLRRADTADLLMEQLSGGATGSGAVMAAALRALGALPAGEGALPPARLHRLLTLATNHTLPFDVRALALDLAVLRSAAMPGGLVGAARRLAAERGAAAHELRRVLWGRLEALAPAHPPVQDFLKALRKDRELGSWHARANIGTSSILWRETGWAVGKTRAALDSAQLALGGVLRRGAVALHAVGADNSTWPLLRVELWARGLSALAGGGGASDQTTGAAPDEDTAAAAGLTLAVGGRGATLPAITLFQSQAELLGHVWAGRGSEPTPVLRAVVPRGERASLVPLLGGVWLKVRNNAAAAVQLDAHASVSLWSRTAAARLQLRIAAREHTRLCARTPYASSAMHATGQTAVKLNIAADLDFYDAVALCVRTDIPPHTLLRNTTLVSVVGKRQWTVRQRHTSALPHAGRTLALGRDNDRSCRTLAATQQ